jgi:hypothetical protein
MEAPQTDAQRMTYAYEAALVAAVKKGALTLEQARAIVKAAEVAYYALGPFMKTEDEGR